MNFASFDFLTLTLARLRSKKKQRRATCPSCHGDHTELANQAEDEEGYLEKEAYVCYGCDCEWDWTVQRPFFRWRRKATAPRWVRLD